MRVNVYTREHYGPGEQVLAGWFDVEKAAAYQEGTRWDGQNQVSLNTRSAHEHETLYRTAGGRWVIGWDSAWQGAQDFYRFASDDEARDWLIRNEYSAEEIEAATGDQLPPEMGRPEIGPQVKVRLTPGVLARVDDLASAQGVSRSAWIRAAVEAAVSTAL